MAVKIDPATGAPIIVGDATPSNPVSSNPDFVVPSTNDVTPVDDASPIIEPTVETPPPVDEPPISEPPVVETVEEPAEQAFVQDNSKTAMSEKLMAILSEYGGESNIPINHEYWDILNKFRVAK